MRDLQKDLEICQAATPGPWNAVRISTRGTTPLGNHDTYATVLDAENIPLIDECWGDGERVYFCYLKPSDARFIAEAREALPYWLQRTQELEAEVNEHRERANEYQTRWEAHRAQDCTIQCAKELAEMLGTYDPVEAARIVRELKAQRSVAIKALRKLRDLLPGFGGLDGRVWRIIDEALAALEGNEQDG